MLEFNGTSILIAISFIVFMFIMQWIFYSPVTNVKNKRNKYIKNNLDKAEEAKNEENSLITDYDEKIAKAHSKANNLISNKSKEENSKKVSTIEETQKKLSKKLENERKAIEKNKSETKESLKGEVVSLAHSISEKVLGENVSLSGITNEVVDRALNQ